MAKLKRIAMIDDFAAYLATITTANGYSNTFPTIDKWTTNVEPKTDDMFCGVKDTSNFFEDGSPIKEILRIEITVSCIKGANNLTTILSMINDVYKCIYTNRNTFQIKFDCQIMPVGDSYTLEQHDRQIATATINFDITHVQNAHWYFDDRTFT